MLVDMLTIFKMCIGSIVLFILLITIFMLPSKIAKQQKVPNQNLLTIFSKALIAAFGVSLGYSLNKASEGFTHILHFSIFKRRKHA